MKRLLNLVFGVLSAYIAYLLVVHNLRPVRVRLDEPVVFAPPRAKQRATHPATAAPPPKQPHRLNLNRADALDWIALPGIGPKLAELIVARRSEIGAFATLDELTQVNGIGSTLVERLRPMVMLD